MVGIFSFGGTFSFSTVIVAAVIALQKKGIFNQKF
jgi:hypothetical protein